MITGCFTCFPFVWAKAIPLPLKTCLQDTSLSSAGRDTVRNPHQLDSVKCSFSERGMMVCPRMTDQDLDQSLNREVEARTETPGYMRTVVLEELSQNHHKHSLVRDYSVSVPPLRPLHSWVVLQVFQEGTDRASSYSCYTDCSHLRFCFQMDVEGWSQ